MLPELTLGADTRREDADYGLLRRLVDEWTRISDLMLQGDYYPLTGFSLLDTAWMAWQFMVPETGEGFVQVFRRANCPQDTAVHRLHGLDGQSTYYVENIDGGVQEISGESLMDEGLAVASPTAPKALIFSLKKKPGDKLHAID
jgi:alpha-galactosidase